jgi:hypothetical protein
MMWHNSMSNEAIQHVLHVVTDLEHRIRTLEEPISVISRCDFIRDRNTGAWEREHEHEHVRKMGVLGELRGEQPT